MRVALVSSPYDLGRENHGMGLGPTRYLQGGAENRLTESKNDVHTRTVQRGFRFDDELTATAEVNAELSRLVRNAIEADAFPLVLGGNCDSSLGVVGGIGSEGIGVIWLDAHGDFGTPDTSPDGYLGSMPLATLTGNCHDALRKATGITSPIPESCVVMAGVRAVEEEQRPLLYGSDVEVISAGSIREAGVESNLRKPLKALAGQVGRVYLHLDIDSLDPEYTPGVDFPAPGGLTPDHVKCIVRFVASNFEIAAASLTAFDPGTDVEDRTLELGLSLMEAIVWAVDDAEKKGK